jgi:hypothetical protein
VISTNTGNARTRSRFERGRIGPVDILEQHQHRLLPRQRFDLLAGDAAGRSRLLQRLVAGFLRRR